MTETNTTTSPLIEIGKRYLVQLKGYQPVGQVIEDYGNGRYRVLCGAVTYTASKEMLSPWIGENYQTR